MLNIYEKLIQGLLDKGFASVDNWLSQQELIDLRKSLFKHQEQQNFHLASIGKNENYQTLKEVRNDTIFWLNPTTANACEQQFLQKITNFTNYLNRTCFTSIRSHEFQYAIYKQGAFYKKHVDQFKNDDKRQFSMVFYLTEQWQEGDGGELLLYTKSGITTIQPVSGRMVFFKSNLPHEVVTSNCNRLSLTGWLKTS